MNAADLRSARAALDVARPAVVRLDVDHAPEHAATDLRDAWAATETALRAAIGGSGLSGTALVGEARTRGVLEYPHAHALLAFESAAERATSPTYRATAEDVTAARSGFQALEAVLGLGIAADTATHDAVLRAAPSPFAPPGYAPPSTAPAYVPSSYAPPESRTAEYGRSASTPPAGRAGAAIPTAAGVPIADATVVAANGAGNGLPPRRRPLTAGIIGAVIALAVVAAGLYWLVDGSRTRVLDQAVAEYRAGQREAARRDFQKAADAAAGSALPHVYLARMAREDGDLPRASSELETATRVEPGNSLAQREIGLLLLQTNHADRAIEYLRTAVQTDPTDRVAMGWLGCALIRVGNTTVAQSFFTRAGQGDWTACRTDPTAATVGAPGGAAGSGAASAGAPATASPTPSAAAPAGRP